MSEPPKKTATIKSTQSRLLCESCIAKGGVPHTTERKIEKSLPLELKFLQARRRLISDVEEKLGLKEPASKELALKDNST